MSTGFILFLAAGVWVGHFLGCGLVNKRWHDGFWIGLIAACFVTVLGFILGG